MTNRAEEPHAEDSAVVRRQLHELQERYQALSELTSGFIYALDVTPEGRATLRWATDQYQAVIGATTTRRDVEQELKNLIHPDDLAMVQRHLASALHNQPSIAAARIITHKGKERWIRNHLRPHWDEKAGRVSYIIGAAKDITRETQAREALYQHENLFWQTFKAINDPALLWKREPSGDIVLEFANPAAAVTFGVNINNFMGAEAHQFFADEPDIVAQIIEAFETGRSSRQERPYCLRTTGERCWIIADYVKVSEVYVLNIIRDISERVAMEQALRESEAKYRALFNEANDAILLENVDDEILDANRKASELLGYTRDALLTMTIPDIQAPERRGAVGHVIRQEWQQHGGRPFETVDLRRDGTRVPVEVSNAKIEGLESKRYLSIVRDISERKKTQAKLEASLSQKEVLLREVHHRVKNSLAVAASMLGLQAMESSNHEVEAALARSQERLYAMARVHEHLYRSEDLVAINMHDYLTGLADHLQASLGRPDVTLHVRVDTISLDLDTASPCGLIVNELVTNALEHAFPPGASHQDDPGHEIRISLTKAGNALALQVSDNGVGLPDPLPAAPSLGLQLVKILAGDLHGTVQTTPTLDRTSGTTVTITLYIICILR